MTATKRPRFSWRGFTTFSITAFFLVMLVSGLVLYVAVGAPHLFFNW